MSLPGGMSVADSIRRAETNLKGLAPASTMSLEDLLRAAEYTYGRLSSDFDGGALNRLYVTAAEGIGLGSLCGRPHVDDILVSLCDLLQGLSGRGSNDRLAISVHMSAWRMLMTHALNASEIKALLEGLRKVSVNYPRSSAAR